MAVHRLFYLIVLSLGMLIPTMSMSDDNPVLSQDTLGQEFIYNLNKINLFRPLILNVWKDRILKNGGVHEWTSEHDGLRVFQEWVTLLELNRYASPARKKKVGADLEYYTVHGNMRSLSRIGTSLPLPGSPKADFDMSLLGCISLLGLFQHDTVLLTNRTYIHLLQNVTHLWGQQSKNYFDVLMLSFQETENHVFMIETTRYLTNQFIWENTRGLPQINELKDSLLTSHLVLDNKKGQLYSLLLKQMHQILKSGYFEFNAVVYQRFTVHALNNLYSFSSDSTIIRAAASVLDYTSTKFIFQSYRSIRLGPYRRHAEKYRNERMFLDDAVISFFGIQSGIFPYKDRELEKCHGRQEQAA